MQLFKTNWKFNNKKEYASKISKLFSYSKEKAEDLVFKHRCFLQNIRKE